MIFASQDPESKAFVVFLTVVVAIINIGMLVWLVAQMAREYVHEQKEEAAKNDGARFTFENLLTNARDSVQRWRFNRMTPEAQQRAIRRRTVDATDGNATENPVTIEMTGIYDGESTGEIKVDDDEKVDLSTTENGLMYENPERRSVTGMKDNKKLQHV